MAENKLNAKLKGIGDFNASIDAGFEALFGGAPAAASGNKDNETMVPVDQLYPFGFYDPERAKLHRFSPYSEEKLQALADDIAENGVLQPLLVRKHSPEKYEIFAGHNRLAAAIKAGLAEVPCKVQDVDDNEAVIIMTSTNLHQRDTLPPCERGWAYRVQLDAMNQQGKRTDLTYSQNENKLPTKKSSEILAEQSGISKAKVYRYIRLTYLIEGYQNMVDAGKLTLSAGENLSHLTQLTQQLLYELTSTKKTVLSQEMTEQLKAKYKDKDISDEELRNFLFPPKEKKKKEVFHKPIKISFSPEKFQKYFPSKKPAEIRVLIEEILDNYFGKQGGLKDGSETDS